MSAIISPCRHYRYSLSRQTGFTSFKSRTQNVCWIMVNPSTADANVDDATIRKVRGFTERMGANSFVVGNLFAVRAKLVSELKTAYEPVGPDNRWRLAQMIEMSDRVIFAWGAGAKMPNEWRAEVAHVQALIAKYPEKGPYAFGLCKDGQPRHPLMTRYDEPMIRFTEATEHITK